MALAPGLHLRAALEEVRARAAAFVPVALDEPFRRRLWREVASGPFRPFADSFGGGLVRQEIDGYDVFDPMSDFPTIAELREELTAQVRADGKGIRGLGTWRPNEVGVARYRPRTLGITPHLDGKSYRRLVAVVTIAGSARFTLCRNRAGDAVAVWEARPGSLVLLRGPGLAGIRDGRPFHMVEGPRRGERCSLGLRMKAG
ncbi:MAG: hypothetical protein ACT4PO_12005 [Actinomycetota bacterium]